MTAELRDCDGASDAIENDFNFLLMGLFAVFHRAEAPDGRNF